MLGGECSDGGGQELEDRHVLVRSDRDGVLRPLEHLHLGVLLEPLSFPLLLGLVVDHHVGLVNDLLLDDLFDYILKGYQAHSFVEGVTVPVVVDLLHQG